MPELPVACAKKSSPTASNAELRLVFRVYRPFYTPGAHGPSEGSGKTGMIARARCLFSITGSGKCRPKKWAAKGGEMQRLLRKAVRQSFGEGERRPLIAR